MAAVPPDAHCPSSTAARSAVLMPGASMPAAEIDWDIKKTEHPGFTARIFQSLITEAFFYAQKLNSNR
jgi:hypothetical protein